MARHFATAVELQTAIAQGRLADARDKARWFRTHEIVGSPSWGAYIDEMRGAALQIERAGDLPTAGSQIGRLGRACSACHEAERARVVFAGEPVPPAEGAPDAQMARHAWAAARLWEGLIGPADERWEQGARVMATSPFDVAKSAHAKPNAEVVELAELLRAQATSAAAITDHDVRAVFFGHMMETCASCHSIVRAGPVTRGPDDR